MLKQHRSHTLRQRASKAGKSGGLVAFGIAAISLLMPATAKALTFTGDIYVAEGDVRGERGAYLDPFPSLGRLDRVRIVGTLTESFATYSYEGDFSTGLTTVPVQFQFGSLPALVRSLPATIAYYPQSGQSGIATRDIDAPVSFSLLSGNYDLSSFVVTPQQADDDQEAFIGLTIPPLLNILDAKRGESVEFNGTVYYDYDLTPAAGVPEPAAWALFVGGFAMVGGAMRQRRVVAPSGGRWQTDRGGAAG